MSEEDQKKLFTDIFKTFLHEDSEMKDEIPVSNKKLREELRKAYESLDEKKQIPQQAISDLLLLRKDPAIWDDGLVPQYTKFLAIDRKPTISACLLSIL